MSLGLGLALAIAACSSTTIRDGIVDGRLDGKAVIRQLERGADPDERIGGWSVMALAILAGDADAVRELIAHGVDLEQPLRKPARVASDRDRPIQCARWKRDQALAALAEGPEREAREWENAHPSDYSSAPTMRARSATIVTPVPARELSAELLERTRSIQRQRAQRARLIVDMIEAALDPATRSSRTRSSRTETSRTETSRTETSRTETSRTETSRTETSRTETSRTETSRTP